MVCESDARGAAGDCLWGARGAATAGTGLSEVWAVVKACAYEGITFLELIAQVQAEAIASTAAKAGKGGSARGGGGLSKKTRTTPATLPTDPLERGFRVCGSPLIHEVLDWFHHTSRGLLAQLEAEVCQGLQEVRERKGAEGVHGDEVMAGGRGKGQHTAAQEKEGHLSVEGAERSSTGGHGSCYGGSLVADQPSATQVSLHGSAMAEAETGSAAVTGAGTCEDAAAGAAGHPPLHTDVSGMPACFDNRGTGLSDGSQPEMRPRRGWAALTLEQRLVAAECQVRVGAVFWLQYSAGLSFTLDRGWGDGQHTPRLTLLQ